MHQSRRYKKPFRCAYVSIWAGAELATLHQDYLVKQPTVGGACGVPLRVLEAGFVEMEPIIVIIFRCYRACSWYFMKKPPLMGSENCDVVRMVTFYYNAQPISEIALIIKLLVASDSSNDCSTRSSQNNFVHENGFS